MIGRPTLGFTDHYNILNDNLGAFWPFYASISE